MNIIIPMAGMGKRMRPHTLVTPKPLILLAGKPIVQHIVEELARTTSEPIEQIAFVIGHFGAEVEAQLLAIAEQNGAKGSIHYQEEALGTAHAVLCAQEALHGKVIVAFADTIFKAKFQIDSTADSTIFVQKVEDPSAFGVVTLDDRGHINGFVEKPAQFVSNLAIIGIYYFNDGKLLAAELQHLIDNNLKEKGEFQITNALENMQKKGLVFIPGQVQEWLDCGNKDATVSTHTRVLEIYPEKATIAHQSLKLINGLIIEPCFIDQNVQIENSVVGPYVSLGPNAVVKNAVVHRSIVQANAHIEHAVVTNSMIGKNAIVKKSTLQISISDYSTFYE